MNIKKLTVLASLILTFVLSAQAQKAAIKTNLIADAVTSPYLGAEFKMKPKWTYEIVGEINAWNIHERRWRHWMVQTGPRLWLCEAFQGHFFGFQAIGGQFNIGNIPHAFKFLGQPFQNLKENRYQGWGVGAGISYGYDWILSKHWNTELEIGIGWIYCHYDRYPCQVCGPAKGHGHHNYYGPTRLSWAIEYVF